MPVMPDRIQYRTLIWICTETFKNKIRLWSLEIMALPAG